MKHLIISTRDCKNGQPMTLQRDGNAHNYVVTDFHGGSAHFTHFSNAVERLKALMEDECDSGDILFHGYSNTHRM